MYIVRPGGLLLSAARHYSCLSHLTAHVLYIYLGQVGCYSQLPVTTAAFSTSQLISYIPGIYLGQVGCYSQLPDSCQSPQPFPPHSSYLIYRVYIFRPGGVLLSAARHHSCLLHLTAHTYLLYIYLGQVGCYSQLPDSCQSPQPSPPHSSGPGQ